MSKLLSIVIPIYNEEKIIATSLPAIFSLELNKEIIIINDGSSDKTLKILEDLKQDYSFTLIKQETNRGKGAAIKLGLENIRGDYFIICDADLEYNPQDIIFLFNELEKLNNDRVALFGSRFLNKAPWSFHFLVNYFLTTLTNLLFGSQLSDMETCFKLIPKSFLKDVHLESRRFEIEPEITAKLLKCGYKIIEKPITYKRRTYLEGKKIKARDGFFAIKTLIKERFTS